MKYINTRGKLDPTEFCDVVLWGIGPNNGLLLPEKIPKFEDFERLSKLSYGELAFEIMSSFIDDIPPKDIKKIIDETYTSQIFCDEITPLIKLDEKNYVLDLNNGPTLAFKDVALQFLGNTFEYILTKIDSTTNILTATSGDTGSAAIEAVKGKERLNIFVLTPKDRMSQFQSAQMYSVMEPNVFNIAIKGNFDDCQWLMEQVNKDEVFREKYRLGSMNSKNWARILAQIVYYAYASLKIGSKSDFVVPTGNFGNILAGFYAMKMGFPIRKLILATNDNNVLDEFFKTGKYQPRSEVNVTNSPSMDISKASNFERFIFEMVDKNPDKVIRLWQEINDTGFFDISNSPLWEKVQTAGIVSGSANEEDRAHAIKSVYKKYGVVIDAHTANGVHVGRQYQDETPMVFLSTANPCKFDESMEKVLGFKPVRPKRYDGLEDKPKKFEELKKEVDPLKDFISKNAI